MIGESEITYLPAGLTVQQDVSTPKFAYWGSQKGLLTIHFFCSPCRLITMLTPQGNRRVESSWNVMAHGDEWEGKWRGNWRMEWVASTLHTTSEHGVSSITPADAHTSAASSRLNWRPRRFKCTRPFGRETKSGFCACAITFQTQSKRKIPTGWLQFNNFAGRHYGKCKLMRKGVLGRRRRWEGNENENEKKRIKIIRRDVLPSMRHHVRRKSKWGRAVDKMVTVTLWMMWQAFNMQKGGHLKRAKGRI